MKRLGVFVAITVLAIGIFGGFAEPTTTFAQTTSDSTQETRTNLNTKADALFTDFVAQLVSKQNNPRQIESLAKASDKEINAYVQGNKNLIASINDGRSTFSNLFTNPAAPSTNIYADFTAALLAAKQKIDTQQRALGVYQIPALKNELKDLYGYESGTSGKIGTLAQERQQDLINTGKGNEAGALQSAVGTQRTEQAKEALKGECGFIPMNLGACITEGVTWIIKNTLLEIAGWLLWLTANMFNYSVQIGILDFAKWAPDSLYPIWMIVRQIVSLVIVFIGLYLGFLYILGKEDKFEKYIPWVVMFALFVNFSYPLARTAIDISNIVSLNIYTSTMGNEVLNRNAPTESTAGAIIVSKLGLYGLTSSATDISTKGGKDGLLTGINTISGSLMVVAFVLYAAYIFLMVTGIMVIRTASLVFITIASPFLLVDSLLPALGDKAQEIRKLFFEQLIVGPVFMILLALTLKFLDVFSAAGKMSGGGVGAAGQDTIVTFFNLTMMLIMLHIMITVTKKIAKTASDYASGIVGKMGSFGGGAALGMATGGAGLLARGTLGRAALAARESKWVTNNQDSFLGKRAYDLTNSVANSTFDLRNSNVVAGKMNKLGIGMGMGSKMGFDEARKARVDARAKDSLERSNRIKTRYERDIYKENLLGQKVLDENGQAVVLHKRGEVDVEGAEAKRRYANTSGGALFLTKAQKERIDDDLTKDITEKNEKTRGEIDSESSKDLSEYNSLKTETEKGNFISNLNQHLSELKKTDKDAIGTQAKAIVKTLESIDKASKAKKEEFTKQVEDALDKYNAKQGDAKEQKNFLSNQGKEIREAVESHIKNGTTPSDTAAKEVVEQVQAVKNPSASQASVDLDITSPLSPAEIRENKQRAAALTARTEMTRSSAGTSAPSYREDLTQAPTATPTQQGARAPQSAGSSSTTYPSFNTEAASTTAKNKEGSYAFASSNYDISAIKQVSFAQRMKERPQKPPEPPNQPTAGAPVPSSPTPKRPPAANSTPFDQTEKNLETA